MAAIDSSSSCGPQANCHPPPPMAQAPIPMGVSSRSLFPSRFLRISFTIAESPPAAPRSRATLLAMRSAAALLIFAALAAAQAPGRVKRTVTDAEVRRVHRSAILIDTHNDVTSATVAGLDLGKPNTDHMTDLARMKKGGMGAEIFAVYVAASYVEGNHAANRTLQMIDTVRHDIIERYPADFAFATTAAEIRRAHKQGKIAALLGIEGGHAIEDSPRSEERRVGKE